MTDEEKDALVLRVKKELLREIWEEYETVLFEKDATTPPLTRCFPRQFPLLAAFGRLDEKYNSEEA